VDKQWYYLCGIQDARKQHRKIVDQIQCTQTLARHPVQRSFIAIGHFAAFAPGRKNKQDNPAWISCVDVVDRLQPDVADIQTGLFKDLTANAGEDIFVALNMAADTVEEIWKHPARRRVFHQEHIAAVSNEAKRAWQHHPARFNSVCPLICGTHSLLPLLADCCMLPNCSQPFRECDTLFSCLRSRKAAAMAVEEVPFPDLRIVETSAVLPHEDHDSQRSAPLIERLRHETTMINPPIVSPLSGGRYVVLDGANRVFAFRHLHLPHILVQIAPYDGGMVELSTWHHVICERPAEDILTRIRSIQELFLTRDPIENAQPAATLFSRHGEQWSAGLHEDSLEQRNRAMRALVQTYQHGAVLQRTTSTMLDQVWHLHPTGTLMIRFRDYSAADIVRSAETDQLLPAGVSRHIVHGRAIRLNFPLDRLRSTDVSLEQKNIDLLDWVRERIAKRQMRLYAEATYQFDE